MIASLINLIFPELCVACNGTLVTGEQHICTICLSHLPETNYHQHAGNQLEKAFWGRITPERAFSFLAFKKAGMVQRLLHELKYGNNPELGKMLGNMYGSKLKADGLSFDGVLAIPLHPAKEKQRGYNQSDCFASGLSNGLGCDHISSALVRKRYTPTQTRKSRFERWMNVGDVFEVANPEVIAGRRLLLVDDVITTGATIEACVNSLIQYTSRISIGSIACVVHQ